MRIFNGSYSTTEGLQYLQPTHFYGSQLMEKEVIVNALIQADKYTPRIHGCIINYRITSPLPNIIRMQIHHLHPQKLLKFNIRDGLESLNVEDNNKHILIKSGLLSVQFEKKNWTYSFKANRLLSKSKDRSAGFVYDSKKQHYMTEKLNLDVGKNVYGTGERFSPFVKNGQHIVIWNRDAATESDLAYKNIPFLLTNNGFGVFVNSTSAVDFEICTEDSNAIRFTVPHRELDYYFIYGPQPKEIMRLYTALTGRAPLIPKWSLGLWLTTSFTTEYNEDVIKQHIDGMFQRQIPLTVFHFDCFWMKERRWCNFSWDKDAFPDPKGMLKRLKKMGLKICLWINPYISELSEIFKEGTEQGFFLKQKNGDVYQAEWWQPGLAFVDFTNPQACEWYKSKLRPLLEMGVDTFKTDFGERIPADAEYHSGTSGSQMHNYYTYLYNQTVFELLTEYFGKGKALVFARSATAGSQKFPVHWGGDSEANFLSMSGQLRGGLSFSASSGAFWTHDIGGFYGKPTADVYKRWIAFGLMSSHSRMHGNESFRVPWNFDKESCVVLKHFTELRHKLIPYIYTMCYQASLTGVPLMRPMFMEFLEDPGCSHLDRQYMLGESLLVAPVFNEQGHVEIYLPEGEWTDYWTGKVIQGGRFFKEKHDYFSLPLYIRENSILPTGPIEQAPLRNGLDNLTLTLYNIKDKAKLVIFEKDEILIKAQRNKQGLQIVLSKVIPGLIIRVAGKKESWPCNKNNILIKHATS